MRAALESAHKGWGESVIIGVAPAGAEISTPRLTLRPVIGADPNAGPLTLVIGYQGCVEAGICYPPLTRELQVPLTGAAAVVTASGIGGEPAASAAL